MMINLKSKKILLVDDDRLFLHVLTQYLDEAQYAYVTCQNGCCFSRQDYAQTSWYRFID